MFIYYSGSDAKGVVLPFIEELEARGISCSFDGPELFWNDGIEALFRERLVDSHFVVFFLTESLTDQNESRTELEAALSLENSQGRNAVLPIVVGDPKKILRLHPPLRDRPFLCWETGLRAVANQVENRLTAATARDFRLSLKPTGNTVLISPASLIDFFGELDGGHGHFVPHRICEILRGYGFLADVAEGKGIVINGYSIPNTRGDWGLPGICDLHVIRLLYKLITGEDAAREYLGRGQCFRAIVRDLVSEIRQRHGGLLPIPDPPENVQGRWVDAERARLHWAPSPHAAQYIVLHGLEADVKLMSQLAPTTHCQQIVDCYQGGGESYFTVRALNQSGEQYSEVVCSKDFAKGTAEVWDGGEVDSARNDADGWEDLGW